MSGEAHGGGVAVHQRGQRGDERDYAHRHGGLLAGQTEYGGYDAEHRRGYHDAVGDGAAGQLLGGDDGLLVHGLVRGLNGVHSAVDLGLNVGVLGQGGVAVLQLSLAGLELVELGLAVGELLLRRGQLGLTGGYLVGRRLELGLARRELVGRGLELGLTGRELRRGRVELGLRRRELLLRRRQLGLSGLVLLHLLETLLVGGQLRGARVELGLRGVKLGLAGVYLLLSRGEFLLRCLERRGRGLVLGELGQAGLIGVYELFALSQLGGGGVQRRLALVELLFRSVELGLRGLGLSAGELPGLHGRVVLRQLGLVLGQLGLVLLQPRLVLGVPCVVLELAGVVLAAHGGDLRLARLIGLGLFGESGLAGLIFGQARLVLLDARLILR